MSQPLESLTLPALGTNAGQASAAGSLTVTGFVTLIRVEFGTDQPSTARVQVWDNDTAVLLADVAKSSLSGATGANITIDGTLPRHYIAGRALSVVLTGANPTNDAVTVKVQATGE